MSVRVSMRSDSHWQILLVRSKVTLGLPYKFSLSSSRAAAAFDSSAAPIAAYKGLSGNLGYALPKIFRFDRQRLLNWFGNCTCSILNKAALPS